MDNPEPQTELDARTAALDRLLQDWSGRIGKYKHRGTNRFGEGYIAGMETCLIQLIATIDKTRE